MRSSVPILFRASLAALAVFVPVVLVGGDAGRAVRNLHEFARGRGAK